MLRATAIGVGLALAPGCRVVDAPDNLEDLMVFTFAHFDDDDAFLIEAGEALQPLVVQHIDDLSGGYRINNPTEDDLVQAGVPEPDLTHIIGALGQADYRHDIDTVLEVLTHPAKDQIFDDYTHFDLLDSSNRACFLSRECETYEIRVEQTLKIPLLGQSDATYTQVYRHVEGPDGLPYVFSRVVNPEGVTFSSAIVDVDQQYQVYAMYPHAGGTRRVEAYWVEAQFVGLEIPDSVAVDQFASSLDNWAEQIDGYIDGQ